MADDVIKKTFDKFKGKKAKTKAIKTEPSGTKATGLPPKLKKGLEELSGANLSKVKVHTGGNAADMCKEVGAKAFTMGNDIFVGKSGDAKNLELLAHELTHVLQQGGNKMPKAQKGKVSVSK